MLRAIWVIIVAFFSTAIRSVVAIMAGFFRKYSDFAYRHSFWPWARSIVRAAGLRVTVSGLENIDPSHSYIIVSNHQSQMDIPVLVAALPLKLTFIAKKELFKIPLFSQAMRAFGILEIDRSNHNRAIETLKLAAQVIQKEKISVLAFPEGTRSRDGKIQRFKKGAFALATDHQIPLLPVTISGTFPVLPKGKLFLRPGEVRIIIHPAVETEPYDVEGRDKLIEKIQQTITTGLRDHESPFQKSDHRSSSADRR